MPSHAQKVIEAEARYWRRVRRARTDLATFIELCVKDEDGQPLVLDYIHRAWVWHIGYCWSRGLRCMVLAPFGSGKSSGFAVPLAAWLIGNDPQIRMKFVCNADEFAKRRVAATKAIIETQEYKAVFPNVRRGKIWGAHSFTVHRRGHAIDPTLEARGVLAKGIGLRSDVVIFDDVVDQLNAAELASRMKVKEFVRQTWLSRLDQKTGRALWIATPWHPDDATSDLMGDPLWCTLKHAVMNDFEHYEGEVFNAGTDYLLNMTPAAG